MKIGVIGGSFDPIHFGHLWIAEYALESLGLDQIRWIPTAQSPLKPAGPVASDVDRLEMLRLALSALENHVVDEREIRRGDVSYTVDTMAGLRAEFPEAELFLLVGSDSLATIRQWHQPQRLLELATFAVVQRGGEDAIDFSVLEGLVSPERLEQLRRHVISMPLIEVSSTDLRNRVREGRSIRFRTPRAVEAMILASKLYTDRGSN